VIGAGEITGAVNHAIKQKVRRARYRDDQQQNDGAAGPGLTGTVHG
jgi:hypothetical protein